MVRKLTLSLILLATAMVGCTNKYKPLLTNKTIDTAQYQSLIKGEAELKKLANPKPIK